MGNMLDRPRTRSVELDELLHTGEIQEAGRGRLVLGGRALALFRWLDAQFERLAADAGADAIRVPALISRETLERAEYEDLEGGLSSQGLGPEVMLTPAICYHSYAMLAGQRLEGPLRLTCAGRCFRREAASPSTLARLSEFTMREIIFLGERAWVDAERRSWMARVQAFAHSLDLAGDTRVATDPFFAGRARGKALIQRLKELKYELTMDVGEADRAAVASFNLHETFFGTRFGITMPDGSAAYSGCVAFGLERWMFAVATQRGLSVPAEVNRAEHRSDLRT